MAFPGSFMRKKLMAVKSSVITGDLNFDAIWCLTEVDFADDDKTLNGGFAMITGGGDFRFSADSAGVYRCAVEIVRCELNANPALSKIEIWIRLPVQFVSDTVDAAPYAWWGDSTATQPAVDADYGRNDVWNGWTGGGTPPVTWAVHHFDGDPGNPTPQFIDSSGNGRNMDAPYSSSRIDAVPGRAMQTTATSGDPTGVGLSLGAVDAPGTGPWCLINVASINNDGNIVEEDLGGGRYITYKEWTVHFRAGPYDNQIWRLDEAYDSSSRFTAMSRSGDVVTCVAPFQNDTITGLLNFNFATTSQFLFYYDSPMDRTRTHSFACNMRSDPNLHWLVALRNNLKGTSIWDPQPSQPSTITAEIYFADLRAGTEVRIYEQPHGQSWFIDLTGITPADLNNSYIQFQIQNDGAISDHYIWFNYNSTGTDPAPGGTGHVVTIAIVDTIAAVAAELQSVANGITDLSATVDGTFIIIINDRNGELSEPIDGNTGAEITLIQIGGVSTDEIDGIETSIGTSWTAAYQILRPRRCLIAIASSLSEIIQYNAVLTTAGLTVPAGALFREDYANE
jgi:hypothetical protein